MEELSKLAGFLTRQTNSFKFMGRSMNNRNLFILLICLVFAFLAGCAPKLPPAQWANEPPTGAKVTQAPKMNMGDYWETKVSNTITGDRKPVVYSKEVVAKNPDGAYKMKITNLGTGKFYFKHYDSKHEYLSYQIPGEKAARGIDLGRYNFPLWVGKRWQADYYLEDPKGGKIRYTNRFIVLAYEPVQVGKNIYQAYKISLESNYPIYTKHDDPKSVITIRDAAGVDLNRRTYWYAPQVREIVKLRNEEGNYSEELVVFRAGK